MKFYLDIRRVQLRLLEMAKVTAEILRMVAGVDLITKACRVAVGDEVKGIERRSHKGHWAEIILHSDKTGTFRGLQLSEQYNDNVVQGDLWVEDGDKVNSFCGANDTIGTLLMQFESHESLLTALEPQGEWLSIITE